MSTYKNMSTYINISTYRNMSTYRCRKHKKTIVCIFYTKMSEVPLAGIHVYDLI